MVAATKLNENGAVATLSSLKVNTDVRSTTTTSGKTVFSFLANVYGEFGIKNLQYALGSNLEVTDFGLSARFSIWANSEAQAKFFADHLVKGASLRSVQATFTVDPTYGLQATINGQAFIEDAKSTAVQAPAQDSFTVVEEADLNF